MSAGATTAVMGGLHQDTDADLLAAAVRRDAKAFGRLVTKYHAVVYRVVWRLTNGASEAEDIAQEAFLKLWNNPAQVREAAALKGWLMRVAHNLAMDWFRQKPNRDIDDVPELSDGRPDAEDRLSQQWVSQRINAALADLSERQRLALTLVHFEQFPQAEAAAVMELTVDAFESLLARARRALKQQLEGDRQDMLATLTERN